MRVSRRGGILYFGEADDLGMYYNDLYGWLQLNRPLGGTKLTFGNSIADGQLDLYGYGWRQALSVRLINGEGVQRNEGSLVAVGGADDSFTLGGVNATDIIGVIEEDIGAGVLGQIAVAGVARILLSAAGVRGQYVATGAVAGQGTCQAGLPAAGRTVGICLQTTGGGGLARCMLTRM
jgi:hypothetical protein